MDKTTPTGSQPKVRAAEGLQPHSPDTFPADLAISREEREARNGHKAGVLWLNGPSGAGKSTIARALERRLFERGCATAHLDGDPLRQGLRGDLGFSAGDRTENIRRAGETARLLFKAGNGVLCS